MLGASEDNGSEQVEIRDKSHGFVFIHTVTISGTLTFLL